MENKNDDNIFLKIKEIENPFYISDPELNELYKNCLPPPESYLYFPKDQEIIILNQKKPEKSLRRIFTNVIFTENEKKWLSDFINLIKSKPDTNIPLNIDTAIFLRFIYSTECNLNKAYNRLSKYINWFLNMFPMTINPTDKIVEVLNCGLIYIYGRDHQFRPIIICQPYIFQKYEKYFNSDDIVNASLFLCQFAVNKMFIPGQIENWVMIINFKGTSFLSLPDPIKKLIQSLSDNFLARLYKCYIIGMSFIIRAVYKLICNFLEEITKQKVVVLEKSNYNKLFDGIREDNLENKFGGLINDLVYGENNCLFPPRMPSQFFIKENEDINKILISEKEYIDLMNNDKIPKESLSPYILEKLKIEKENMVAFDKMKINDFSNGWIVHDDIERLKMKSISKSNNSFIDDMLFFNNAKKAFKNSINHLETIEK